MLTLLLFQSYLISRWHREQSHPISGNPTSTSGKSLIPYNFNWSFQSLWSKFTQVGQGQSKSAVGAVQKNSISNSILKIGRGHDSNQKYCRNWINSNRFGDNSTYKNKIGVSLSFQKYFGMSLEDKFRAAVKVIHSLPKDGPYQPSNGTKLKFYGLYKQATDGQCNTSRPGFWDVVGRYKWDAWNNVGTISKEEAMSQYVDGLKEIVETMSFDGNVQDFLTSIGPFYEFVNLQGTQLSSVKEKIDQLTSSSGSNSSSNSSSITTSPVNSCPNSPLKSILDQNQDDQNESISTPQKPNETNDDHSQSDSPDISEKAEVQVQTRTATFETKHSHNHIQQNHVTSKKSNGYSNSNHHHHQEKITPPTPQHTYNSIRKNSFDQMKQEQSSKTSSNSTISIKEEDGGALDEEDETGDEVMGVSVVNCNVVNGNGAKCKEDLEQDDEDDTTVTKRNHQFASVDTLATSGTESEKYYSGDSEPEEIEDNPLGLGTSKSMYQQQNQNGATNSDHSALVMTRTNLPPPVPISSSKRQKSSPKMNGLNHFVERMSLQSKNCGDVVLQSTVERLNRDVDHILARLRILETAYATSASNGNENVRVAPNSRRKFLGGVNISSTAFVILWPFVVHFLIRLISWWWRRRRMMARRLR